HARSRSLRSRSGKTRSLGRFLAISRATRSVSLLPRTPFYHRLLEQPAPGRPLTRGPDERQAPPAPPLETIEETGIRFRAADQARETPGGAVGEIAGIAGAQDAHRPRNPRGQDGNPGGNRFREDVGPSLHPGREDEEAAPGENPPGPLRSGLAEPPVSWIPP